MIPDSDILARHRDGAHMWWWSIVAFAAFRDLGCDCADCSARVDLGAEFLGGMLGHWSAAGFPVSGDA